MKFSRLFTLNDEKLSQQPLFVISLVLPFFISCLLSIPLWMETEIQLSANGYEFFLNQFKLPIGILSLSIPFVAIVAHIHRTIQTAAQIEATRNKNTTDSFFSHYKFMMEAFSKLDKVKTFHDSFELSARDTNKLYHSFFSGSSYTNGIITNEIKTKTSIIQYIITCIEKNLQDLHASSSKKDKLLTFIPMINNFKSLENHLAIELNDKKNTFKRLIMLKDDSVKIKLVSLYRNEKDVKEHLAGILYFVESIFNIINQKIDVPQSIYLYANLDLERYNFMSSIFKESIYTSQKHMCSISTDFRVTGEFEKEYVNYLKDLSEENE